MKMIYSINGSKKETLETFQRKNIEIREQPTIEKMVEKTIVLQSFKINMLERIKPTSNCSSCGK